MGILLRSKRWRTRLTIDNYDQATQMAATGFNHFNLRAPRPLLDELRDFYCSIVGLRQGDRPPFKSFGYWLYADGRDILHLTEAKPDEIRATRVATTFDHVAFTCADLPGTETRLRQYGVRYELDHVPLTGQRQIFLQ